MPGLPHRRIAVASLIATVFVLTVELVGAERPQSPNAPQPAAQPAAATADCIIQRSTSDNGIGVSDPKIFDNRSLALMLDSLSESLRTTQFVDAKSLAASLSLLQGSQQESVARSFSLQGAPIAGVVDTTKATTNTGATLTNAASGTDTTGQTGGQNATVTTDGKQVTGTSTTTNAGATHNETVTANTSNTVTSGGTTERTTQTTTAARTPVNPDLPALLAAPTYTPQFGTSATDLLSDQVNLTYQIFNLRMLLERALSDRLIAGAPRLQAVLGFNVTLDPPRDWRDSAAFVEVTLQMRGSGRPISVVALMPQEKTYNSVALSNKSTAFGGSAVSQVISIGYSERRQSQLFYLFRDNDTIAFHRNTGQPDQTQLGWSFRPVLGRRSVSPGIRQMFAVISLPAADRVNDLTSVPIDVQVNTYWRSYDRKTLTTANTRKTASATSTMRGCVDVPTTAEFQDKLSPSIENIHWRWTDDKNAVVTVQGSNFFQGTAVRLGGSTYATPADGLTLKSDKAFDLAVPVSALLGDGSIVGRYGVAGAMLASAPASGIRISNVEWRPPVGGRIELAISLSARNGALTRATMPPLLVSLNGIVIPPPYNLSGDGKTLRAYAPTAQFSDFQGLLSVRSPFAGDDWQTTWRIYDPDQAFTVTRFAAAPAAEPPPADKKAPAGTKAAAKQTPAAATQGSTTTKLLIATNDVDNGFMCPQRVPVPAPPPPAVVPPSPIWKVVLDKSYEVPCGTTPSAPGAVALSGTLMEFVAPTEALDRHALLLVDPNGTAYKLTVPAATARPAKTSVDSVEPGAVKLNDARKVTIKGKALDHVASVTANGIKLESRAGSDGTTLDVFLVRRLTDHAATITLICRDDKDDILGSIDIVVQ